MASLNMWVHYSPSILRQGRLKHADPVAEPGVEEPDPEALMAKEIEKDPWEPRLKNLTLDASTKGGMPAWIVRGYNHKNN